MSLDASFTWAGVETKEVERELFEDDKVMSGMLSTGAHLIVGEDDIHVPVKVILDMPVLADGGSEAGGVRGKAGNVEMSFGAGFAFEEARGFDYGEGFQSGPAFGAGQTVELPEGVTTAMFDAAMVFFEGFIESMRGLFWDVLEQGK